MSRATKRGADLRRELGLRGQVDALAVTVGFPEMGASRAQAKSVAIEIDRPQ